MELRDNNRSSDATRTTTTDANGVYTFQDVPVGQYTLDVQLPPGQELVSLPPLTVNVTNSDPVSVPPAPLARRAYLYLPEVKR